MDSPDSNLLSSGSVEGACCSDLRHPFGAREVTVIRAPRPLGLPLRVYMQHDPRDLAPVGAVRIGIERAEVRDEVLFVVSSERWIGRRGPV